MIFLDPLAETVNRRCYVPLDSSERALAALTARLREGRSPVLLTGSSGIGKTLLLHVLAERERSRLQRVRLSLSLQRAPNELAGWLLHYLFRKWAPEGTDAEVVLVDELHGLGVERMLLLVDQIQRAPRQSVRKLAELARAGMPELAVVVAGTDGEDLRERIGYLAPEATVSLPDSLANVEIETLYETILADPGLSPRLRSRLANVERGEILHAAAGLPLLLKKELLRQEERMGAPAPQLRCVDPQSATRRAPAVLGAAPAVQTEAELRGRPPRIGSLSDGIRARARAFRAGAQQVRERLAETVMGARWTAVMLLRNQCALLVRVGRTLLVRVGRKIGTVARAAAAVQRSATQLARAARESVRAFVETVKAGACRPATWLAASVVGARLTARAQLMSASAYLTRLPTRIGATARSAGAGVQRTSTAHSREAREGLGRVRPTADMLLGSLHVYRGRVQARIAVTARWAGNIIQRATTALSSSARRGKCGSSAALDAARQAARRAAPATALLVVAMLCLGVFETASQKIPAVSSSTEGPFEAVTPPDAAPMASSAVTTATSRSVNVQVNARPWARVRIDGKDLGLTPFSQRLAPGVYQLEAKFPGGQTIRRNISVSAQRRFVSLP